MELISPEVTLISPDTFEEALHRMMLIEEAGRTCYKSQPAERSAESAARFIQMVIRRGHESVLEHAGATFRITCDRGVTHELVRHRLAAFSQESTRFVNYAKKIGIQFIHPITAFAMGTELVAVWEKAMAAAEDAYLEMIALGAPPELARSVLPNSTRTEIVMTCNFREWRHICRLRRAPDVHPQMREIANMIYDQLAATWRISGMFPTPDSAPGAVTGRIAAPTSPISLAGEV